MTGFYTCLFLFKVIDIYASMHFISQGCSRPEYLDEIHTTSKSPHQTGPKTKIQAQSLLARPPAVPNGSKISTRTHRNLSTFISAVPRRAPPGRNCPIYSFNLALKVRTVRCRPISDKLQMHKYDLVSQTDF